MSRARQGPWWLPPGHIGEELGWRGWLVRTWRDRPITALALSASAWAAFHLPVVVLMPPLHAPIALVLHWRARGRPTSSGSSP